MMKLKVAEGLLVCGLGLAGPWGCAETGSKSLDTALFIPPAVHDTSDHSDNHAGTRSGDSLGDSAAIVSVAISPDPSAVELPKKASVLPAPTTRPFDAIEPLGSLQLGPTTLPVDMQTITAAGPTSAPASVAGSDSQGLGGQGVYMTLGCVIVQVNNTPIYAGQVLSPLRKEFTAKAREMDPSAFKDFARQEIAKQLQELIEDELYFATAFHALSDEDRKLAEGIAMQVRQERITAAGGSIERAKHLSLDEGLEFHVAIQQEYRRIVHGLYQRRIIEPLIQVSADDMREYYRLNLTKLYSEKDKAQFRVIEIDPAVMGSMAAATDKIDGIRERAVRGDDFATLASAENQNDFLKGRGGNPCDDGKWMERNTYLLDAVEAAVWKLEPGQITPVIQTGGALYIARLEAKRMGTVRPFEDQSVQDDIYNRLHQQQLGDLWRKSKADSTSAAILNPSDDRAIGARAEIAVDMAMQTYAQAH